MMHEVKECAGILLRLESEDGILLLTCLVICSSFQCSSVRGTAVVLREPDSSPRPQRSCEHMILGARRDTSSAVQDASARHRRYGLGCFSVSVNWSKWTYCMAIYRRSIDFRHGLEEADKQHRHGCSRPTAIRASPSVQAATSMGTPAWRGGRGRLRIRQQRRKLPFSGRGR